MTTLTELPGRSAVTAVAVTAIVLALTRPFAGYPVVTPAAVGGLLVPAAVAAVAAWRWRLLSPAAVLTVIGGGVLAVEIATPGPVVAALGDERLTTGTAVLEAHLAAWPLTAALLLLAAVTEAALRGARRSGARRSGDQRSGDQRSGNRPSSDRRSDDRPGWGRALGLAAATGLVVTGCTALTGVLTEGWVGSPPPMLAIGLGSLALSVSVPVLMTLRGRLVAPAVVLGAGPAVSVVVTVVTGGTATTAAALLVFGSMYGTYALLAGGVEAGVRAVVRRVRRRGSATGAAATVAART